MTFPESSVVVKGNGLLFDVIGATVVVDAAGIVRVV